MQGVLIAIDPGRVLGIAVFRNTILLDIGVMTAPRIRDLHYGLFQFFKRHEPAAAIIEVPQVYRQRKQKGDPNDLIDVAVVAGVAGAVAAPWCEPLFIKPHIWKGSRPKDVDNEYTLKCLNDIERAIVDRAGLGKTKGHNAIDAIGIGLWALERR